MNVKKASNNVDAAAGFEYWAAAAKKPNFIY